MGEARQHTKTNTYPFGLACTRIELHKYQTVVAGYGLLITPTDPRDTLTFFVYHQPYRRPLFSLRPSSSLSTPGVRH